MTEPQRLFLVQARSDFAVFDLLWEERRLPVCHALHYLQMATELLGKAHAWRHGPNTGSHRAIVGLMRGLSANRQMRNRFGYTRKTEGWRQLIRETAAMAQTVEDLAPALTPDGPNPEYPWPRENPKTAPAEYMFPVAQELRETVYGRSFLNLLRNLFAAAEMFL